MVLREGRFRYAFSVDVIRMYVCFLLFFLRPLLVLLPLVPSPPHPFFLVCLTGWLDTCYLLLARAIKLSMHIGIFHEVSVCNSLLEILVRNKIIINGMLLTLQREENKENPTREKRERKDEENWNSEMRKNGKIQRKKRKAGARRTLALYCLLTFFHIFLSCLSFFAGLWHLTTLGVRVVWLILWPKSFWKRSEKTVLLRIVPAQTERRKLDGEGKDQRTKNAANLCRLLMDRSRSLAWYFSSATSSCLVRFSKSNSQQPERQNSELQRKSLNSTSRKRGNCK